MTAPETFAAFWRQRMDGHRRFLGIGPTGLLEFPVRGEFRPDYGPPLPPIWPPVFRLSTGRDVGVPPSVLLLSNGELVRIDGDEHYEVEVFNDVTPTERREIAARVIAMWEEWGRS